MKTSWIIRIVLLCFLAISTTLNSQEKLGIEEHLGQQLPLDLKFVKSNGDTVELKSLVNKPTIFYFVYFHCGGICNPMQNAVADGISRLKLEAGQDYNIITVCFDPKSTTDDAKNWMNNTKEVMNRYIPNGAWNVLIGDSLNIKKLADAAGFYYKPDGRGDFIHAGTIFTISPTGHISRYLYFDKYFNPFDLKMALFEAGKSESNPTIRTVLQYCFSYDPKGKTYVFNATKIIGVFMLLAVGGFFAYLVISGKKRNNIN